MYEYSPYEYYMALMNARNTWRERVQEELASSLFSCRRNSVLVSDSNMSNILPLSLPPPSSLPSPRFVAQRHAFFMFWTTEEGAGEYDVPQCSDGTPTEDCVYTTTATMPVRDSMRKCTSLADAWCAPNWDETSDVLLLRAGTHCHAPACMGTELYICPPVPASDADSADSADSADGVMSTAGSINAPPSVPAVCNATTGTLLCANRPVYGTGKEHRFDEPGMCIYV